MSSPNSNSNPHKAAAYDLFLSFRGEDTRSGFTSHLHDNLIREGYKTFYDDESLKKGKAISEGLLKAIEGSRSSVVVLSENYAFSGWCLTELAKIVECMEAKGLIVLPIFYHVNPSHVRKQAGSYEKAFKKHENNYNLRYETLDGWRDALKRVGNLAGWTLKQTDSEAKFIKDFITDLSNILQVQKETQNIEQEPSDPIIGLDIVIPGRTIPAWFTNTSYWSSISLYTLYGIRVRSIFKYGDWLGLFLCVCFGGNTSSSSYQIYCEMKYLNNIWEVGKVRCPGNNIREGSKQYVWLFYLPSQKFPKEWLNDNTNSLQFSFRAETKNQDLCCGPCGFRWVYTDDIQELNQIITTYRSSSESPTAYKYEAAGPSNQFSHRNYDSPLTSFRLRSSNSYWG
ncbi:hypothetical protein FNV43_RR14959 [Rhamnella rubrinervis]|uniref:TIR domain-containing protein n=1 Tax=Rhamnella rubrinervis TaxID=2594499 RepID=A0A8K0MGW0_9ROSA|nr:hypothetical protein FNV43_RR14959 [Rhamnella rubrinervis]